jgi:hypothetical protein
MVPTRSVSRVRGQTTPALGRKYRLETSTAMPSGSMDHNQGRTKYFPVMVVDALVYRTQQERILRIACHWSKHFAAFDQWIAPIA